MHFKSSVTLLCLFLTLFIGNQSECLGNGDDFFDAQEHNALNKPHYIREMKRIPFEGDYLRLGLNYNDRDEVNVKKRNYLHVPWNARGPMWNGYLRGMRSQSKKKNSADYLRVIRMSPEKISKRYYLRVMKKRNDAGNPFVNQASI